MQQPEWTSAGDGEMVSIVLLRSPAASSALRKNTLESATPLTMADLWVHRDILASIRGWRHIALLLGVWWLPRSFASAIAYATGSVLLSSGAGGN